MTPVPLPQLFLIQMWYFHPWSNDLEFYSKRGLLNVLIVYSHKVALQIKGKTSVRWDRRKVGHWEEELHSHPNIVYKSRRYKEAFFFPLTVSQFWWHEHDAFCSVTVKSFKWFSIYTYVWAGWSCYLALLQPSDVMECSELWERWWCHLTGAFVSARVFRSWIKLISFLPCPPPATLPLFLFRLRFG